MSPDLDMDALTEAMISPGTTLFWYISTLPELIVIAGGCFPEGSLGEPTLSVTHAKKVPWLELPPRWQTQD